MPYTILYKNKPGYLYVRIEGPESYDEAVLFWENLAKKSKIELVNKFLIVDEVIGRLKTFEIFKLSKIISDLFRGKKIAFIDPKEATFEDNKFGETVVTNRGVIAKVFRSEDVGLEWLFN